MLEGLKYLRPGYRRLIYLFSLTDPQFDEIIKNKFRISVSYRNSIGEYKTEEFSIDLSQFQGLKSIASTEYEAKKQIETDTWSIDTTTSGTSNNMMYVSKDPSSHVSDVDYRYEK